ncbi:MAG TPA: kelch repeat-containing protein [Bryobacteraceae bacterium]
MRKTSLLILLVTATVTLVIAQPAETPAYNWSKTGPLQVARQGACAAALKDGRILVAGGQDANGALRSVEIYQQDGSFAPARDMLRARGGHACTSLSDGRILVAGGLGDGPAVQAETYDPVLDIWTAAGNGIERWNQTATMLPDGRVLLAGGETADGPSALLEWFNPATNRIRPLPGTLSVARTLHASAVLPDGTVLVSGGWNAQNLLDSMELIRLDGSVASAAAALPAARAGHTATTLDNGCQDRRSAPFARLSPPRVHSPSACSMGEMRITRRRPLPRCR